MKTVNTPPNWLSRCLKPSLEFCERESSYQAKGICMLLILAHHIYIKLAYNMGIDAPVFAHFLVPSGYLGTGLFFFLSGYGLFGSLCRQNPLKYKYLTSRLSKMLFVYIFAFVLSLLFSSARLELVILKDLFTLTLPGTTTWFFKVICILYIVSFLVFRFFKVNYVRILFIFAISIGYYIIARRFLPDFWYTSILCFPVGMLVSYKKSCFGNVVQMAMLIAFCLCFEKFQANNNRFVTAITFSFAILFIIRYLSKPNQVFKYIGDNSLCFYMFQLVVLQPLAHLTKEPLLYIVMVLSACTLLTLVYTKWIESIVNKLIK